MKFFATTSAVPDMTSRLWQPVSSVPLERDIEVAVVEGGDIHALVVCCRRVPDGWINAATGRRIDVNPTHWRKWQERGAAKSEKD
jgi:hypothetical protein